MRRGHDAEVTSAVERDGGDAEEHDEDGDDLAEAGLGMTSPYPTVVTVWAAHHADSPKLEALRARTDTASAAT